MSETHPICERIAKVRLEYAGPRGKRKFSSELGLSPSTYDYYEKDRVPPAEVLVRVAELAEVDLRWLLTGELGQDGPEARHPAVRRMARLLAEHPASAQPLTAFLDILEQTMEFPAKSPAPRQEDHADAPANPTHTPPHPPDESDQPTKKTQPAARQPQSTGEWPTDPPIDNADGEQDWIPILGRSAAGVPAFWTDNEDTAGLTTLGDLIRRHAEEIGRDVRAARVLHGPDQPESTVQLITLRAPSRPGGQVEFLATPRLKQRYPDAFAVRIDGASMSPEIAHGDLVLLSPSRPAAAGQTAVVQLAGAIGVTCKLYHPDAGRVHLVPINEAFPPTTVSPTEIQWALTVLATVRP